MQLTDSGRDFAGYCSPDGKQIAFLTARNTYDPYAAAILFELWIMHRDGSHEKSLISVSEMDGGSISRDVSWSRDSRNLLVQVQLSGGRHEIRKVTVDGEQTRLTASGELGEHPAYSPDGSKIAYLIQGPNPPKGSPVYRLYVCGADFTGSVLIDTGLIEDYTWNSDSDALIYTLYDPSGENFDLYLTPASGKDKLRLSNTPVSETNPACSEDGLYIAYTANNAVVIGSMADFEFINQIDNARMPAWIPGRQHLLISCLKTTDKSRSWTESRVVDIEGQVLRRFSSSSAYDIHFSSDGDYFVFSRDGDLWIDQL